MGTYIGTLGRGVIPKYTIADELITRLIVDANEMPFVGEIHHPPFYHIIYNVTPQSRTIRRLAYPLTDGFICCPSDPGYIDMVHKLLKGNFGQSMRVSFIKGTIHDCVKHSEDFIDTLLKCAKFTRRINWYDNFFRYNLLVYGSSLQNSLKQMTADFPSYYWFRNTWFEFPKININKTYYHHNIGSINKDNNKHRNRKRDNVFC